MLDVVSLRAFLGHSCDVHLLFVKSFFELLPDGARPLKTALSLFQITFGILSLVQSRYSALIFSEGGCQIV